MAEMSASFLLKLSPEELTAIDRVRGEMGRSAWVRALCAGAVKARDEFGGPCVIHVSAKAPDG